jgi:hypothetical protein
MYRAPPQSRSPSGGIPESQLWVFDLPVPRNTVEIREIQRKKMRKQGNIKSLVPENLTRIVCRGGHPLCPYIERGRKKRIANCLMPVAVNGSYAGYGEEVNLAMQITEKLFKKGEKDDRRKSRTGRRKPGRRSR